MLDKNYISYLYLSEVVDLLSPQSNLLEDKDVLIIEPMFLQYS